MKDEKSTFIKYSKRFTKQRKSVSEEIKIAFRDALELFLENPEHSSLRNHALKENLSGYRSIDVTDDYRAIYRRTNDGKRQVITFHLLGTHKKLYGK